MVLLRRILSRELTRSVSFSICTLCCRPWEFGKRPGGDDTTSMEHDGTFCQLNSHVEGWCMCSRRVFSCRTGTTRLLLEPSFFPSWRKRDAWSTCMLWTCLVFCKQFCTPSICTLLDSSSSSSGSIVCFRISIHSSFVVPIIFSCFRADDQMFQECFSLWRVLHWKTKVRTESRNMLSVAWFERDGFSVEKDYFWSWIYYLMILKISDWSNPITSQGNWKFCQRSKIAFTDFLFSFMSWIL